MDDAVHIPELGVYFALATVHGGHMFFGDTRQAFLEFLSRLTPQALFLTLAIVFGSKLDLSKFLFTWQGLKNALPMALCITVFMGAALASVTLFIEKSITSDPKHDKYAARVRKLSLTKGRRVCVLLRGIWVFNKRMLVQIALVLGVMEVGFLATIVVALQAAMSSPLLKLHG